MTPGKVVSIYCNIDNHSTKSFKLRATLNQQRMFYALGGKKKSDKNVYHIIGFTIKPKETLNDFLLMPIPAGLVSINENCPIIQISYTIIVSLHKQGDPKSRCISVSLPIIVTN